jgi:hypothetical protein
MVSKIKIENIDSNIIVKDEKIKISPVERNVIAVIGNSGPQGIPGPAGVSWRSFVFRSFLCSYSRNCFKYLDN